MSTTAFVFVKGNADSEIENLVAQAQAAAALDTLENLRDICPAVVATGSAEFGDLAAARGARIELDASGEHFHFGARLAFLVDKYKADMPLYVGGGSGALMRPQDWRNLVQQARDNPGSVISNNFHSCDFAVWSPGPAIRRIEPPELDNDLAFRLAQRGGLRAITLPKRAATQLDIDTPSDLLTLSAHDAVGENLNAFFRTVDLDTSRVDRMRDLTTEPTATLVAAGRVSASMALFLEKETACQWRFFIEERGMRASGRQARGEARSLVGFFLERVGHAEFFEVLARLCQGALIDSRVLFAHHGLRPSAIDRFHSDLLMPERITDSFVREFTRAARDAAIPVVLGGHSLVSGGMYALVESNRASAGRIP